MAAGTGIVPPPLEANVEPTLSTVSVYRVAKREDARDFIGFKHINGPHRWDSIAKAQFAATWYKAERAKQNGLTLRDIARRMGDRHDTIQRMVAGFFILEQAKEQGLFHPDDRYPGRQFAFSHLYTALTRPGYRQFLGLSGDWRQGDPKPNPVVEAYLPNLKRVLRWLYGSKADDIKPIVTSQNPHVKQLGEVLSHSKARTILLTQDNLELAYSEVDTPQLQFEKSLIDAHGSVQNAIKKVSAFDGTDTTLLEIAREIKDTRPCGRIGMSNG